MSPTIMKPINLRPLSALEEMIELAQDTYDTAGTTGVESTTRADKQTSTDGTTCSTYNQPYCHISMEHSLRQHLPIAIICM